MQELNVPKKLCLTNTKAKVRIQNQLSDEFNINEGLTQGDALSTTLLNLALEQVIRKTPIDRDGTIFTKLNQVVAYAHDIDIISWTLKDLEKIYTYFKEAVQTMGLEVNNSKTKYMITTREKVQTKGNISLSGQIFERMIARISFGNKCFYSLQNIIKYRCQDMAEHINDSVEVVKIDINSTDKIVTETEQVEVKDRSKCPHISSYVMVESLNIEKSNTVCREEQDVLNTEQ
uniref:Uncharacterized protein LOC114340453 n=1 Tax=Diabrotica virgifera virgifera TaxID=50390 RepID=A0A6P7GCF0_DIAVI